MTALAALCAIMTMALLPGTFFLMMRDHTRGVIAARAEMYADDVGESARTDLGLWDAMIGERAGDRLDHSVITRIEGDKRAMPPERRRIRALGGRLLVEDRPPGGLAWPLATMRVPVRVGGHLIGEVEISRSLRPDLVMTLVIGALSTVLGLLLLLGLRTVPLRLMREALERESFLAAHDALTGLPNRALLTRHLEQALAGARRSGLRVGVLCLDVDHFKTVNDALGHAAGDMLLCALAGRFAATLRESDTLARLGSDEFMVVQPEIRTPCDAERLVTRLMQATRPPFVLDGQEVRVGLTFGIALSGPGDAAGELLKQADMALDQAKASARASYCFFAPEMNERVRLRRAMEQDLREAFAARSLEVHYQPQVDLLTGTIVGAEALIRWPRRGERPVPPSVFIPIAEETGLIHVLGAWLLDQSCREASGWPEPMYVAVNVSPVQFRHPGFLNEVRGALVRSGLAPRRLELEVTEGILLEDTDDTLSVLSGLRAMGVRLAMDDFGTGYSSLGYLRKFRFDKIKIDQSFVQTLGRDPEASAIVRAVVSLSEALGIASNAEGVEKAEQAELLRTYGCGQVQGYHFWPPMPAAAFAKLLGVPGPLPEPVAGSESGAEFDAESAPAPALAEA